MELVDESWVVDCVAATGVVAASACQRPTPATAVRIAISTATSSPGPTLAGRRSGGLVAASCDGSGWDIGVSLLEITRTALAAGVGHDEGAGDGKDKQNEKCLCSDGVHKGAHGCLIGAHQHG